MGRGHWNVGCREGFYSPLNWVLVWKRGNREGEIGKGKGREGKILDTLLMLIVV